MKPFSQPAMQSAEEMQRKLVSKSVEDLEFRKQLMSDPKKTIQKEFGVDFPENTQVQVHVSDMNTIHLSIPPGELEEEQLEAIAAGRCCC
ncbi:MAG: NHLP leader peptide family RiPP precursor [Nitrospira sp.]|nr:NHLP leader peptide family RiPP precursor [Nitrospira sp.]MCY3955189.1 NHLP leader peptide family RiPP precursor [Nitrospira sp.]MCY4132416.1 NHLP leader peptide family RiPP precursor [Nitrospira sp.]